MDASAFWNVIGEYNAATMGLQIALMIILIASVILSYTLKKGWIVKVALSAVNLFIAIGFFAAFGTEPIQHYFALPLYTAVGLLFAYDAWKNKGEQLRKPSITQWFFIALYIIYPFASLACGHTYPQLVTYIMPCPVITISIALYAGYAKRNKLLTALLVVWALTGVKALIFNAYEDLILFAASFYGIALLIEDYKALCKKKSRRLNHNELK